MLARQTARIARQTRAYSGLVNKESHVAADQKLFNTVKRPTYIKRDSDIPLLTGMFVGLGVGFAQIIRVMATALPDRVSFVEAHRRFMALENPSTAVSDPSSKAFQDELTITLQYQKKCIQQRQLDGVLSSNERFFELQNTQLYALCIEYYLGMLTPKQTFFQQTERDEKRSGPTDHTRNVVHRIKFLREADVFLSEFLDRAESVGLLTEKKRREQYERLESKQFSLSRDEKVQRFQLQREMEKKLQQVQKRREEKTTEDADELEEDDMEDLEREQLLTFIQLSVVKSMEEQASINQEKEMLETMLKMNATTEKQDLFSETHRPPPPPQGQGIEVTRINPQMEMRRETVRSGVFKPGHRLPTMTLEEYADREVADAMERQKREQEAPQGPRRYDQLVEDGDEDDDNLVEEAAYKDRAWDDWKDANEKGIGNKKGSQF
ncbi:TAP42-like family [Phytophthora infestans]|uniref:TAP42-like family n=1 Tax=Phytophthora infestans TaxID=4787 RepID=A0A8S9UCB8_PHYIN|nr:TAP42-like family [Phytophthora infestans]